MLSIAKVCAVLALGSVVAVGAAQAQTPAATASSPAPARRAVALSAKIAEIKGNQVTIVNERGQTRTFELASVKGLAPGQRTGWCEDDCRKLPLDKGSIAVKPVTIRK